MGRMILNLAFVLAMALATTGCGSSSETPVSTIPVKGKVTFKGRPVTSGSVVFEPEGMGRQAQGEIQPDGSFELTTYKPADGAVPGPHRVSIKGKASSTKLPIKYASAGSSQLEQTVQNDKSEYLINLE